MRMAVGPEGRYAAAGGCAAGGRGTSVVDLVLHRAHGTALCVLQPFVSLLCYGGTHVSQPNQLKCVKCVTSSAVGQRVDDFEAAVPRGWAGAKATTRLSKYGAASASAALMHASPTVLCASYPLLPQQDWRPYMVQELCDGGPMTRLYGDPHLWPPVGQVDLMSRG